LIAILLSTILLSTILLITILTIAILMISILLVAILLTPILLRSPINQLIRNAQYNRNIIHDPYRKESLNLQKRHIKLCNRTQNNPSQITPLGAHSSKSLKNSGSEKKREEYEPTLFKACESEEDEE